MAQQESWKAYSDAVNRLQGLNPEKQAELVQSLKPKPGADYAARAPAYEMAVKALAADQKARATDPTAYVIRTDTKTADAKAMLQKMSPETVAAYAGQRDAALEERGMQDNGAFLPAEGVTSFAEMINGSDKPAGVMTQMQNSCGPRHFNVVMSQLARGGKIPFVTQLLVDMPQMAGKLLFEAGRNKDFNKEAENLLAIRGATKTGFDDKAKEVLGDFLPTLMAGGDSPLAAGILEATRKLALQYMMRLGYWQDQALARAAGDVVLDRCSIVTSNDRKVRIPKGWDADTIDTGMKGAMREVASHPEELDSHTCGNMKKEDVNRAFATTVRDYGYWVTNGDESGVILFVHDRPVTRGGKPVTQTWAGLNERGSRKAASMRPADVQALMED